MFDNLRMNKYSTRSQTVNCETLPDHIHLQFSVGSSLQFCSQLEWSKKTETFCLRGGCYESSACQKDIHIHFHA